MFRTGGIIALVGCSNPLLKNEYVRKTMDDLNAYLESRGVTVQSSPLLYDESTGKQRADVLMDCCRDPKIRGIFDVSGGDVAHEVIPYLDFQVMREHPKPFFGYSDLTCVMNAMYSMADKTTVLYQVRNLVGEWGENQRQNFDGLLSGGEDLFQVEWDFWQGEKMDGILLGGNVRCFLKLRGTAYFPDLTGKLLFLEARSGNTEKIQSYFRQLQEVGAFEKISGLLLGTFTELEASLSPWEVRRLLLSYVNRDNLPVAKTRQVGHGADSKGLKIGSIYRIG